jgi:hypothetical protein
MIFSNSANFVTKIHKLPSQGEPNVHFPPLASSKIYELANLFINLRSRIIWERKATEQDGITETEYPYWEDLFSLEGKLDRMIKRLDAIAFTALVEIDLDQFNKEIIGSTQRLIQAAEQLRKIRDNIRKFVVIVDDVLSIVTKVSAGGAFEIFGVFDDVTKLLGDLGLDLPKLPISV